MNLGLYASLTVALNSSFFMLPRAMIILKSCLVRYLLKFFWISKAASPLEMVMC